ncbi:MAG: MFS transporter [Chloroherpetonaceae bacterium]|nr:MFS transporter [Chthonomonadaceae bacterium]MDW8208468.1 MFS transporter [Chloroherpetonaceae bacterium]
MTSLVTLAAFAELAYVIVNISAMPVYVRAIALDARWIGVMTTAYLLMEGVFRSPFGVLGDRIGRKALIVTGPALSTLTALLTPSVTNPFVLLFLRVLDGLGAAALWPAAFSLIGDHIPLERRGAAMSQFNLAYLFGLALGPAIGGLINDAAHYVMHVPLAASKQASFYAAACLFAATTGIALFALPGSQKAGVERDSSGTGVRDHSEARAFRLMLQRMPATLLLAFLVFFGVGLVMAYMKIFVLETFRLTESAFGLLMMGPAIVIGALSMVIGRMTDRFGKARTVRVGLTLCACAYWALLLVPQIWSLVVFGSLIGLGFVAAFPAWMALVSEASEPRLRGAAVGAVGTAQGIGALLGASLSALLYRIPATEIGPIPVPAHGVPFVACGVVLICAAILAQFAIREPGARM